MKAVVINKDASLRDRWPNRLETLILQSNGGIHFHAS